MMSTLPPFAATFQGKGVECGIILVKHFSRLGLEMFKPSLPIYNYASEILARVHLSPTLKKPQVFVRGRGGGGGSCT